MHIVANYQNRESLPFVAALSKGAALMVTTWSFKYIPTVTIGLNVFQASNHVRLLDFHQSVNDCQTGVIAVRVCMTNLVYFHIKRCRVLCFITRHYPSLLMEANTTDNNCHGTEKGEEYISIDSHTRDRCQGLPD